MGQNTSAATEKTNRTKISRHVSKSHSIIQRVSYVGNGTRYVVNRVLPCGKALREGPAVGLALYSEKKKQGLKEGTQAIKHSSARD